MIRTTKQRGLTLIEVMLVVVITAILAAVVITGVGDSQKDAEEATIRYSLREMRSLIPVWWVKYDVGNGGSIPVELMKVIPKSPVTGYSYFTIIHTDEPVVPGDVNQTGHGGWLISSTTQGVWLNSPDYVDY